MYCVCQVTETQINGALFKAKAWKKINGTPCPSNWTDALGNRALGPDNWIEATMWAVSAFELPNKLESISTSKPAGSLPSAAAQASSEDRTPACSNTPSSSSSTSVGEAVVCTSVPEVEAVAKGQEVASTCLVIFSCFF